MKKTISIMLALVLVLALAIPAFAVEPTTGEKSQEVTATYVAAVDGGTPGTVYNVTITWTQNETHDLTYNGGSQATYKWNADTLKYEVSDGTNTEAGWSGSTGYKVTVTNRSNANVTVNVSAEANYGLTASANGATNATLDRADQAIYNSNSDGNYWTNDASGVATSMEVTYTYSNTGSATAPENASSSSITVGKITVSLN